MVVYWNPVMKDGYSKNNLTLQILLKNTCNKWMDLPKCVLHAQLEIHFEIFNSIYFENVKSCFM